MLELIGARDATIGSLFRMAENEISDLGRRADGVALGLRLNGAQSWCRRVTESSGAEALFDSNFRFLAVSNLGRTFSPQGADQIVVPRRRLIGKEIFELMPGARAAGGETFFGVPRQAWSDLLGGRLSGLLLALEINHSVQSLRGVIEFWPVKTIDCGMLLHSVTHRDNAAAPSGRPPGLYFDQVTVV